MQAAIVTKPQALPCSQAGRAARPSRRSGGRRRPAPVRAVASTGDSTDIGAMFRDALASPTVKKVGAPSPVAPPPAPIETPPPAPIAPPPAPIAPIEPPPAAVTPPPAPIAPPPAPTTALPDAVTSAPAGVTMNPVPGTEIFASAPPAPPPPPPPPTQGMDFVLEQLQSKPPGYGGSSAAAAKAAKEAAVPLTDSLASAGKGLGDAGAAATKGIGSGIGSAAESLGDAGAAATKGLNDALGGAASVFSGGASGAADAAANASAAAAAASAKAAAAASEAADKLNGALTGAAGGAASSVQEFLGAATREFETEASIIKANLDSFVGGVSASVDSTTSAFSSAVSDQVAGVSSAVAGAADQLAGLLPPQVASSLYAVSDKVGAALQTLAGLDQTTAGLLAGVGLGLPALLAWNAAYGGFAGNLEPEETLQLLQTEDAVLVDIRPDQQRATRGVAELKRGARGKGAAVPPVQLLPSVSRRVRDPAAVALQIQVMEVAALAKISAGSTKVIIMDQQGEAAKRFARALRAAGVRRPYVLADGFRGWCAAGLGVREGATEYDAGPLGTVEDVAESVAEQAASQLAGLRKPKNAVVAAAAAGGLGLLTLNFHSTLQYLGVLGLELTLVSRALSYGSLGEAVDDLQALYSGTASILTLPARAAEKLGRAGRGAQQAAQQASQQPARESKV
ncbi:hypothetical protein D9Q98_007962 [Chlorella vulgaris]|uniref:Rhodanese domain-containing protein n=1 Tax=Chlorella vulgaris TaxID=3077 RepID=A0A9D4THV5_CHLVU|nr:hypothetical protein D9Q98_007962 [Chlorella vulgaris]